MVHELCDIFLMVRFSVQGANCFARLGDFAGFFKHDDFCAVLCRGGGCYDAAVAGANDNKVCFDGFGDFGRFGLVAPRGFRGVFLGAACGFVARCRRRAAGQSEGSQCANGSTSGQKAATGKIFGHNEFPPLIDSRSSHSLEPMLAFNHSGGLHSSPTLGYLHFPPGIFGIYTRK